MKYANEAEQKFFYDFVFYETDKKAMHAYCPNCLQEYETKITATRNVAWLKRNYRPCECFAYRGKQPEFKHSRYAYAGLNRVVSVGEFENRGNGDAALCAYWYKASFGADNYDAFGYAFKRRPVFDEEKVIEILFKSDGSVAMKTCLHTAMCSRGASSGTNWREVKNWQFLTFEFDIIPESVRELKGTCVERYVPDIERFLRKESEITNTECAENETVAAFLIQMHTSEALKRLWKVGYDRLVVNKTFEYMCPRGQNPYYCFAHVDQSGRAVNYRGKTVEKILRIPPSKLDCVCDRSDLTPRLLRAAQRVSKIGAEVTAPNVRIADSYAFDYLIEIIDREGINAQRAFKFMRHEINKGNNPESVVSDYRDYLSALQKLGTPFTDDVVFPSKPKEAHDRATSALKAVADEIKRKSFVKAVRRYAKASFTDGTFAVSVIGSIRQLNGEAAKMHNCSAGYVDRIIDKTSVIFKIREKARPRKAFCMLEYNPKTKTIVQNRGIGNAKAPEDVIEFAQAWLQNVLYPLERKMQKKYGANEE